MCWIVLLHAAFCLAFPRLPLSDLMSSDWWSVGLRIAGSVMVVGSLARRLVFRKWGGAEIQKIV